MNVPGQAIQLGNDQRRLGLLAMIAAASCGRSLRLPLSISQIAQIAQNPTRRIISVFLQANAGGCGPLHPLPAWMLAGACVERPLPMRENWELLLRWARQFSAAGS
jgi:hypothetical protein